MMSVKQLAENRRRLITARWNIARLMPRAGFGLLTLLVTANVVVGALPVVFVIATAVVVGRVPAAVAGGLGSPGWDSLVSAFIVAASAFLAQQVVAPLVTSLGELVARRIDGLSFDELMTASLRSPGVALLEEQAVLDDLRTAARELEFGIQSPGQAVTGQLALVARYTQLVGYAAIIGVGFSWLAAAGIVVAVMLFRYGQRGGLRKYGMIRWQLLAGERKSEYLLQLAVQSTAAKEIRVFGLLNWLKEQVRQAYLDVILPIWAERRRIYLWPYLWFAAWGLAVTGVVFAVVGATAADALTLTTFLMVMQAALAALLLGVYYPEADLQTEIGLFAHAAVQRFVAHVDAVAQRPDAAEVSGPVPDPVETIRFDKVSFSYPGQSRKILDDLDLTIPVGKTTAIVGLNGAGKTTMVKLLARLYEPTSGAVRADGVDVRDYDLDAWRAKLAVIFQQFVHYEVSAAENIGFGAVEHLDDRAGIRAAAEAVGLASTLDDLPRGLDTPLARHLTDGAELSGGQWQRVALARALFALRHGSPIVVLDEPTASLDVRAEATFFDEFSAVTEGATTLLISHRFSTVRHADLIVVLEDGKISEQGSHEELLGLDGRYAALFRLQADRFTDADAPADAAETEEVAA